MQIATHSWGNFRVPALIRYFEFIEGELTQVNQQLVPQRLTGMVSGGGESLWLLSAANPAQVRWTAPFTLAPVLQGFVSIYRDGTLVSTLMGQEHQFSAVTWDVSGSVWAATTENELYHVSVSGTILSKTLVPPYPTQSAGAALGISSLLWWNDHLYAASAFNGLLIEVL